MGCCETKEKITVPRYKSLTTSEVSGLIPFQVRCFFCNQRIPHPYILLEECSNCHIIGHTECISKWKSENLTCPKCDFIIVR